MEHQQEHRIAHQEPHQAQIQAGSFLLVFHQVKSQAPLPGLEDLRLQTPPWVVVVAPIIKSANAIETPVVKGVVVEVVPTPGVVDVKVT